MKCSREKKITQEIPTTENFGPTNTREKILTHEIHTRKNFRPTKYPQKKILDPRNTHEKKFWTHEIPTKTWWHDGTKPKRPTTARNPRNWAHSLSSYLSTTFLLYDNWGKFPYDITVMKTFRKDAKILLQFIIFKLLSYCFKETIRFDVQASFLSRPLSRLIRWYNKSGDITSEFWEKAFYLHGHFMDWKLQTGWNSLKLFPRKEAKKKKRKRKKNTPW